jgi:hypothetical protein
MLLSRNQNAGQNYDIKIANSGFENVAKFEYLGTTITNRNLTVYYSYIYIYNRLLCGGKYRINYYESREILFIYFLKMYSFRQCFGSSHLHCPVGVKEGYIFRTWTTF